MTHAVDVTITGRVQGVFFRAAAEEQAGRFGVSGWVRNEPDGSVSGHFEGERAAVDRLVDWCRTGPPAARVRDVAVNEAAATGATTFDQR